MVNRTIAKVDYDSAWRCQARIVNYELQEPSDLGSVSPQIEGIVACRTIERILCIQMMLEGDSSVVASGGSLCL